MSDLKVPSSYGGRSTSQISIYDYPEHLNPFYEDENHKRIRFWRIGKNKSNGENSRRGSFSLSGIKEMWAFKTFRLKKKSSNLGINKTSESPPPLRRGFASNENHYGTYDSRMRHTMANNTLNDNFLRNVPYRASLQDMRSTQKIEHNNNGISTGFERNNRYRSTIQTTIRDRIFANSDELSPQVPPRRYVYGGSVTPQPRLRSNDFNEDYSGISRGSSQISVTSKNPFEEDDDVVIGEISSSESKTAEKHKRHVKKKRRAPPPPVPIPKVIDEELRIDDNSEDIPQESAQITNLAVEIQNFVKSVDKRTEDDSMRSVEKDIIDEDEKERANINTEVTIITEINPSPSETQKNIYIIENTFEQNSNRTENLNEEGNTTAEEEKDDSKLSKETPNTSEIASSATPLQEVPSSDIIVDIIELKITESIEDLSERSEKSQKSEISNEVTAYVDETNKNIVSNECEKQQNRRRSVREIIESINRNQKLLKINQTQNDNSADNDLNINNIKAPPRRKYNLKEEQNEDSPSDDIFKKSTEKINNNNEGEEGETFEKCEIKKEINRESSPISSNLDWNPVPKPKRIKKLSIELQKTNTIPNDSEDN